MISKHLCICVLLFAFLCHLWAKTVLKNPQTCRFGVGKPPGNFFLQSGRVIPSQRITGVHHTGDLTRCQYLCGLHEDCWFIEVRAKESKCIFYDKNSRIVSGSYAVAWWDPCYAHSSCRLLDHRCEGFWLLRDGYYFSGPRVIKKVTKVKDSHLCRRECLSIPLCAAFNLRYTNAFGAPSSGYCELLFPQASNRTVIANESAISFEWHCCQDDDKDLQTSCRHQQGKCRGRWTSEPNVAVSLSGAIGQVVTLSKLDCMSFCERNPFCSSVFFSQAKASCILRGEHSNFCSVCAEIDPVGEGNSNWLAYRWTCCDLIEKPIQPYNRDSTSLDAVCVCLNASVVGPSLLASDGCIEPITEHNVTINSSMTAFWLRESNEVTVGGKTWTRVFNGEIYLWVATPTSQLKLCPKHRCDIYSTVIDPNLECPTIVKRSEWFARPSKDPPDRLLRKPFEVAVMSMMSMRCPEFGCYSRLSCSNYVRQNQNFFLDKFRWNDIAYNFLVGEDGNVYEGRGADVMGAHSLGLNRVCEGVAMIGLFENREPSVAGLRAMRLLFRCLAARGEIEKDYRVVGHKDIRPDGNPGKFLYELLPNWHGYFRSKLPPGPDCGPIFAAQLRKSILKVISSVSGPLISIIFAFLYIFIWRHARWCPIRRSRTCGCKSNSSNLSFFCSVGRQDAFEGHIYNEWLSNYRFCRAATLQIRPSTKLFILTDDSRQDCSCFTFISLLWARCVRDAILEFPSLLSNALAIKTCHQYRILVSRESESYILHVARRETLRTVLHSLQANECLCRSAIQVHPVVAPELHSLREFKYGDTLLDARFACENHNTRIKPTDYCYFVENLRSFQREVTYEEFSRGEEEGSINLEFDERGSIRSNDTCESEVETII